MKSERLLHQLGQVDEDYIAEATPVKKANQKRGWIKWAAAAACLCLVIGGAFCYKLEHPWPTRELAASDSSTPEIAEVPRWEDMGIYEQYCTVEYGGRTYTARAAALSPDRIGAELASAVAAGWDEYAGMAGENAARTINAAVSAITGISAECAVAVQYEGTDAWYACVNSAYRPQTLGQFLTDLDLRETVSFGPVFYSFRRPLSGESATVRFDGVDSEQIWSLLLSAADTENVWDDVGILTDYPREILGISVSLPLLGYENISLSVHEGGSIITNILDTGKMFRIGTEHTQAFVDYVLKECDGYEVVWVSGNENPIPE